MAESIETQGTSLQFRLLNRRVKALESPLAKVRSLQVALLQGRFGGAAAIFARRHDNGVFEKWPHP